MDDLVAINDKGGEEAGKQAAATYNSAKWAIWTCLALVIFVGFGLALMVANLIAQPLQMAVQVLKAVAGGDLTQRVDTTRKDEIGDMQAALAQMVSSLSDTVNMVRTGADSVATASAPTTARTSSSTTAPPTGVAMKGSPSPAPAIATRMRTAR